MLTLDIKREYIADSCPDHIGCLQYFKYHGDYVCFLNG